MSTPTHCAANAALLPRLPSALREAVRALRALVQRVNAYAKRESVPRRIITRLRT